MHTNETPTESFQEFEKVMNDLQLTHQAPSPITAALCLPFLFSLEGGSVKPLLAAQKFNCLGVIMRSVHIRLFPAVLIKQKLATTSIAALLAK